MIKITEIKNWENFKKTRKKDIKRVLDGGIIPTRFNSFREGCYLDLQNKLVKNETRIKSKNKRFAKSGFPVTDTKNKEERGPNRDLIDIAKQKRKEFGINEVGMFPCVVVYEQLAKSLSDEPGQLCFLIEKKNG